MHHPKVVDGKNNEFFNKYSTFFISGNPVVMPHLNGIAVQMRRVIF